MPARVLIADDHPPFADALEAILAGDRRVTVVGRAANGDEAVRLDAKLRPDVVLMDISMPGMGGIEATATICAKRPGARVLILTGSDAPADIDAARRAGAAGYVTKEQIAAQLVQAILDAAAG